MKKIILNILVLFTFFIVLVFNTSFAITGKVNDANIRVRSGPSTEDTETLTNLYLNDPVEVIERTGDWYKITTSKGITGYIAAEFVNVKGNVPGDETKTEEVDKPEEKPKKTETKTDEKSENKVEDKTDEEIVEDENIIVKIKKSVIGRYMPLMYSNKKTTFKKNEDIAILDEKGLWSKIVSETNEAWVLTADLEY